MKTGITVMVAALGALGGTGIMSGAHVPFLSGGYVPPAECVQWYNGCNRCVRTPDGSDSCTDRSCQNSGKGFCVAYATATAQTQ